MAFRVVYCRLHLEIFSRTCNGHLIAFCIKYLYEMQIYLIQGSLVPQISTAMKKMSNYFVIYRFKFCINVDLKSIWLRPCVPKMDTEKIIYNCFENDTTCLYFVRKKMMTLNIMFCKRSCHQYMCLWNWLFFLYLTWPFIWCSSSTHKLSFFCLSKTTGPIITKLG